MNLNKLEIKRQLLHICIGTITLFLIVIGLLNAWHILFIIVFSSVLSVLSKKIKVPVVSWFLDNFEREKDKKRFPGKGFIAFFMGTLLSIKLFEPSIAYASIMVLTLGDTVSHLIGKHVGQIKNPLNGFKSIEGSVAGAISGFIGASFFVSPSLAAAGAFGAMFVEAIQIRMNEEIVDDNIVVPLVCGACIMIARAMGVS
ncbi:MAG: hypothetical protein MAG795_00317 [Candidatus Woesearchaeota archaeon]|nr:hypothetical protein [Candidatus Woesearchaeota archaeon]